MFAVRGINKWCVHGVGYMGFLCVHILLKSFQIITKKIFLSFSLSYLFFIFYFFLLFSSFYFITNKNLPLIKKYFLKNNYFLKNLFSFLFFLYFFFLIHTIRHNGAHCVKSQRKYAIFTIW